MVQQCKGKLVIASNDQGTVTGSIYMTLSQPTTV